MANRWAAPATPWITAEGEATFASPDAVMVAATAPAGNEAWIGHPFAEVQQRISQWAGLSRVPQANAVVQHSKVNMQAIIISFIICR